MLLKTGTTTSQEQPPEVFCKKGVIKNFTEFTGKSLRQRTPFLQNTSGKLILTSVFLGIFRNLQDIIV